MEDVTQLVQLYDEMKIGSFMNYMKASVKAYESTCLNDEVINCSYEQEFLSPKKNDPLYKSDIVSTVSSFFSKCTE
jgi:hypothetical protein